MINFRENIVGSILSYLNIVAQIIVNLIYVPLLLKYLGKETYGIYQYFLVIISYMSIAECGLTNSIIRFYTEYVQQKKFIQASNLLAMAMRSYAVICIILFLFGVFIYFNLDNIITNNLVNNFDVKASFFIFLLNLILSIGTTVFTAVLNVNEKFIKLRLISLISNIVPAIIIVLLLEKYTSILLIAMIQFVINIIIVIYKIYYCKKILRISIKINKWDWTVFKKISSLALSVLLVVIADQLFWRSNILLLGFYDRLDDLVYYSIATSIFINFMTIGNVVPGIFSVRFLKLLSEKSDISQLFFSISRYQFILLSFVFSGFCIFGKEFIILWIGKEFIIVYWLTVTFLVSIMIDLSQCMLQTVMQFNNIYWYKSYIYVGLGFVNFVVISFLINMFNIDILEIAIITSLLMFLGNSVLLNYICKNKVSLNFVRFWKELLISFFKILCIILLFSLINMQFLTSSIWVLVVKIILYSLLFFIINYFIMLTVRERVIISSFIRRKIYV